MPAASNPATRLIAAFKSLGLSPAQVRTLVPSWWDDAAADDPGALLELQILLARRLNVSLTSLQSVPPHPAFRPSAPRFKTVHPEGSSQLAVAASLGQALAHLVASGSSSLPEPRLVGASELRRGLLERQSAVTLAGLCDWLWAHGVPVVHILNWPPKLRRPDAMCLRAGGRPIVVIVRNEAAPAKLAYLVAHEVGHVMSGHLRDEPGAVLVDEALPVDAQQTFHDADEQDADAYAMTVLGGEALQRAAVGLVRAAHSELSLTVAALAAARASELDPGQVILAWGRLTGDWKLAAMALRYLMTTAPAPVLINESARQHLDFDELSNDAREHLETLTGLRAIAT